MTDPNNLPPIRWSETPPEHTQPNHIPIYRCTKKHGHAFVGLILSHQVIGTNTHFRGRTIPCPSPDSPCPICAQGAIPRWVGYVAALHRHTGQKVLLEVTPLIATQLAKWRQQHGSLRGTWIHLRRKQPRDTAPLEIVSIERWKEPDDPTIPENCDVQTTLERIWRTRKWTNASTQ